MAKAIPTSGLESPPRNVVHDLPYRIHLRILQKQQKRFVVSMIRMQIFAQRAEHRRRLRHIVPDILDDSHGIVDGSALDSRFEQSRHQLRHTFDLIQNQHLKLHIENLPQIDFIF